MREPGADITSEGGQRQVLAGAPAYSITWGGWPPMREKDAGINEMRNPIWSTGAPVRFSPRLCTDRTSSISSPINMDLGKYPA